MKIKEKLASREVDGELYIVDIEAEKLHSLNPAGAVIWECLKKGFSPEKTAERVTAEFDVPLKEALEDIKEFVKTLKLRGLVK
jgi:hypothetical protein